MIEAGPVPAAKPRRGRRWCQFSLLSLFLLVLAASIVMTRFTPRARFARRQRDAVAALRGHALVYYDYQSYAGYDAPERLPGSPLTRTLFGIDYLSNVDWVRGWEGCSDSDMAAVSAFEGLKYLDLQGSDVTWRGLEQIEGLPHLVELRLPASTDAELVPVGRMRQLQLLKMWDSAVTDQGLKHLRGLTELRRLTLGSGLISGEGLQHLSGLSKLEELVIRGTNVGDAGMVHVAKLRSLQRLSISGTGVTEAGLGHLTQLRHLRSLLLPSGRVSPASIAELRRAMPECEIYSY